MLVPRNIEFQVYRVLTNHEPLEFQQIFICNYECNIYSTASSDLHVRTARCECALLYGQCPSHLKEASTSIAKARFIYTPTIADHWGLLCRLLFQVTSRGDTTTGHSRLIGRQGDDFAKDIERAVNTHSDIILLYLI